MKHLLLSSKQAQSELVQELYRSLRRFLLNLPLLTKRTDFLVLLVAFLLLPKPLLLAQDVLLGLTSTGGAGGGGTAFSIKSTGSDFSVLNTFVKSGAFPSENLCKSNDGNFYGMTRYGGANDLGTIFKMTLSGEITILRSLSTTDGVNPYGSLVQGTDGNFYGMTFKGGANDNGTIFKITPTGIFTVLRHLDFVNDVGYPFGSLVQGTDGNFYGMTYQGEKSMYGSIFKITPTGTFTVLRHLDVNKDGGHPYGNLVQGPDGSFYGMTNEGGAYYSGTIFKITSSGIFTVLRHLNKFVDGGSPYGSLIKGADGHLYGMTYEGGANSYGTIFKITSSGTFTVLGNLDYKTGGYSLGSLVQGTDGSFYGMTGLGGNNGLGTCFKITAGGTFTVLYNMDRDNNYYKDVSTFTFNNYSGYSLVQGADGNFYGMTSYSRSGSKGSIFKITPTGTYSLLVQFPETSKGIRPLEDLIQANDGYFYGTTNGGGQYDLGTIFKMCQSTFSGIKSFDYNNGSYAHGNLIQGADGDFYGMAGGGMNGGGIIFKITPAGTLTVLRDLTTATDGGGLLGSLLQGKDGNLYGMTHIGGANDHGTIFKITPDGTFTLLQNLNRFTTGASPYGSLIQGSDGTFYGMTSYGGTYDAGTIFKLTSTGVLTVLRHLDNQNDGYVPASNLVLGVDGKLYGMATFGGKYNNGGTVFKIATNGTFEVIYNFNYITSGSNPRGSLVQTSDGNLYGMTSQGGANYGGTIFKITTNGVFTILRHLNKNTDGGEPNGSLIIQKADPVAQAQSVSTTMGTAKAITLNATAQGSPLTYTIVSQPKNGTLSGSGATRTYTPKAGYSGSDTFTFTATWGCQTSKVQTVSINVTGSNPLLTLAPVADAYVRNGTYATTNYGQDVSVQVKGSTKSGYSRSTYLKFSLGSVSSVRSAKLRIYGSNTENTANITTAVYGIENDIWTEEGITWNNAPIASSPALSSVGVNNQTQYYELDVTNFVQAQLSGDKTVSLLLKDGANQNKNLSFNSKENAVNPPQLMIESAPVSTIRLNSGGSALTTSLGSFSADAYFSGATSITTSTAAIANTSDDGLYQTTRKAEVTGGSFAYAAPVSNGSYTVRLHFVELAFISTGKRKFNVSAEGASWLTNYDIYAAAGGAKKAVVASKNVTVNDGMLNLNFISVVDKASIAAIEILPATTGARLAKAAEASESAVQLYPNPATEKITVKLSQPAQHITTTITDVTGAKHSSNRHQQVDAITLKIPVSTLPPAVYLLYLQTEHGRYTLKFVKQ